MAENFKRKVLDGVKIDGLPLMAQLDLSDAEKTRLTLRSRWFEMAVRVQLAETRFHMTELAELNEGGDLRRHSQRFGAF